MIYNLANPKSKIYTTKWLFIILAKKKTTTVNCSRTIIWHWLPSTPTENVEPRIEIITESCWELCDCLNNVKKRTEEHEAKASTCTHLNIWFHGTLRCLYVLHMYKLCNELNLTLSYPMSIVQSDSKYTCSMSLGYL